MLSTLKSGENIRRRRKCKACGHVFATIETLASEFRRLQRNDRLLAKLKP